MICYKNQPLIDVDNCSAIGRSEAIKKRKVEAVDKEIEEKVYIIGFLLFGATIQWHFDNEKERDFVFDNVLKEVRDLVKIDNFSKGV